MDVGAPWFDAAAPLDAHTSDANSSAAIRHTNIHSSTLEPKRFTLVFDTNIFISNLKKLREITENAQYSKHCRFAVPWVVLQELDRLKMVIDTHLSVCSRKAIEFISSILDKRQSATTGAESDFIFESALKAQVSPRVGV